MRWLVTGSGGMLGTDLKKVLRGRNVTYLDRAGLDVTDRAAVLEAVGDHDVVVNAAAYTRVDDAESDVETATAVNAVGAENLAIAAQRTGARLIQVSTDYVFDGAATDPYSEAAPPHPVSAYGRSKADGERLAMAAHPDGTLVLRTAWLYGAGGNNFISALIRRAETDERVSVVADQRGQPTWTMDVAGLVATVVDANVPAGIYHATNSGECSRFEFAREIFRLAGLDGSRLIPVGGDQFVRPAPRPAYSVLGHRAWARVGVAELRPWEAALAAAHAGGVF